MANVSESWKESTQLVAKCGKSLGRLSPGDEEGMTEGMISDCTWPHCTVCPSGSQCDSLVLKFEMPMVGIQ